MSSGAAVALAALLVLAVPLAAQPPEIPEEEKRALRRHLSDLTDCLAYYSIAGIVVEKAGQSTTAAQVGEVKDMLLDRSFIVVRVADMDQDAVLDRQKEAVREQMALMDNDLGNFAVLTEKYGTFCKDVVESPESRIEHWRERVEGEGADPE